MRVLWVLTIFALAVSAFPIEEERINGENGWYIPQQNGTFVWMDLEEAESKLAELKMQENSRAPSTNLVTFHLYTSKNPTEDEKITTITASIEKSHFNAMNPTRFIIHGWNSNYKSLSIIRDAWLSTGDYNIIAVDWVQGRSFEYMSSVAAVATTGQEVASMIDFLVKEFKMSLKTLDVTGHSLGAHVSGYTGKNVKTGQIHTIVGLDPALPLFSLNKPKKRLCTTDAFYVESITTNGGKLGFLEPIGQYAFYPNGGKSQPGCGFDPTGSCSHGRSVTYYSEAVKEDSFPSQKCSGYEEAVKKNCSATYGPERMGAPSNAYLNGGLFYVPVNSKAPFRMDAQATLGVVENKI